MLLPKAYPEPCQTSKIELFARVFKGFRSLNIFAKYSIFDIWQGSEYAFVSGKFLLIGIYSMQNRKATTRHGVKEKEKKTLKANNKAV